MIIWLGPRGFAGRVCTVQTDPDRESVRPGGSPDMKQTIKPMMAHTSQSQSGRGVVLTIHRDDVVTELFGSQSQSGRGVVLTSHPVSVCSMSMSLNPSPAGG